MSVGALPYPSGRPDVASAASGRHPDSVLRIARDRHARLGSRSLRKVS